MAIEIVDFPIKNGDFPWQNVSSPEGNLDDLGATPMTKRKPPRSLALSHRPADLDSSIEVEAAWLA